MPKRSSQLSIDPKNRLVVTEIVKDSSKEASYEATLVSAGRGRALQKMVLDGKWSLTGEHDLKLHVLGSESPYFGKTLILRGTIESVDESTLAFRVRSSSAVSGLRSQTIELKGVWLADANNRLTFNVAKANGRYDALRLQGAWQVNRQNELIYKYSKTDLKTRVKKENIIIFKGWWDFGRRRLIYRFDASKDSYFSFKAALEAKRLKGSDGKIKYQVGIKYLKEKVYRTKRQTVTIFGTWKLEKDLRVGFEVAYSSFKRTVSFEVEKLLGKGGKLTASLKSASGEKLGFEVMFSKAFNRDTEAFLALSRMGEDSRIMGGVKVKF